MTKTTVLSLMTLVGMTLTGCGHQSPLVSAPMMSNAIALGSAAAPSVSTTQNGTMLFYTRAGGTVLARAGGTTAQPVFRVQAKAVPGDMYHAYKGSFLVTYTAADFRTGLTVGKAFDGIIDNPYVNEATKTILDNGKPYTIGL